MQHLRLPLWLRIAITLILAAIIILIFLRSGGNEDYLALFVIPILAAATLFGSRGGIVALLMAGVMITIYSVQNGVARTELRSPAQMVSGVALVLTVGVLVRSMGRIAKLNEQLRELSYKDSLTGLHNRRYISDFVAPTALSFREELIRISESTGSRTLDKTVGVCLLDADRFKAVNDTYGHEAGDTVLKHLADLLSELVRFDDDVVRWGGEEFVVVLNRTTAAFLHTFVEEALRRVQSTPVTLPNGVVLPISVSIGATVFPFTDDGRPETRMSFEDGIGIADGAMYLAKRMGRARGVIVDSRGADLDYGAIKQSLEHYEGQSDQGDLLIEVIEPLDKVPALRPRGQNAPDTPSPPCPET